MAFLQTTNTKGITPKKAFKKLQQMLLKLKSFILFVKKINSKLTLSPPQPLLSCQYNDQCSKIDDDYGNDDGGEDNCDIDGDDDDSDDDSDDVDDVPANSNEPARRLKDEEARHQLFISTLNEVICYWGFDIEELVLRHFGVKDFLLRH